MDYFVHLQGHQGSVLWCQRIENKPNNSNEESGLNISGQITNDHGLLALYNAGKNGLNISGDIINFRGTETK